MFDSHQDSIQKPAWHLLLHHNTLCLHASCALASVHTPEQQGAEEARLNCHLLNRRPAAASQAWARLPWTALVHRRARASWSVCLQIWSRMWKSTQTDRQISPQASGSFFPNTMGHFNSISEILNNWYANRWQKGRSVQSRSQKDDREEETEARRRVRTHSFLERPCQILKLFALSVLQNLAVLHASQPHVPAEDLRWRAELLANGGFWSGVFDLVEKSRRESSVWWGKLLLDGKLWWKEVIFSPSKRPRSAF